MAAIGFDDVITIDDERQETTVLPAGDYEFSVVKIEKRQVKGGDYLGRSAIKALLKVETDEGVSLADWFMILDDKFKWKIVQFARAIGVIEENAPKGTQFKMDWNNLVGSTGSCQLSIEDYEYEGKHGQRNKVERVYRTDDEELDI